jgi:hypothetical protein
MKAIKENKRESRYRCDFSMEWAYFNKIDRFDCTLLNYNKNGGYLESAMGPLPGSTIFIRLKPCNKIKPIVLSREQPRSATLARVEWCRAISEKKQTAYGVGIKYFEYYGG